MTTLAPDFTQMKACKTCGAPARKPCRELSTPLDRRGRGGSKKHPGNFAAKARPCAGRAFL